MKYVLDGHINKLYHFEFFQAYDCISSEKKGFFSRFQNVGQLLLFFTDKGLSL